MKRYVSMRELGNANEITAMVKRLELRGLVGRKAALTDAEIARELTKIKNDKARKEMEG